MSIAMNINVREHCMLVNGAALHGMLASGEALQHQFVGALHASAAWA
jgi:hypothetical protein